MRKKEEFSLLMPSFFVSLPILLYGLRKMSTKVISTELRDWPSLELSGCPVSECTRLLYFNMLKFSPAIKCDDMLERLHELDYYIVILYFKGGGFFFDGISYTAIKEKRCFFISPKSAHAFKESESSEGVFLTFSEEFLSRFTPIYGDFVKYEIFSGEESTTYCDVADEGFERISAEVISMMELESSLPANTFGHYHYLFSLFSLLILNLKRYGVSNKCLPPDFSSESYSAYLQFKRLVNDHFRERRQLKDFASMLGLTDVALTKCVSMFSQKTPKEIINHRLGHEIRRMLSQSDLSVKEIAWEMNFCDASYLVKFFKKLYGITPAEYKRALKA